MIRWVSGVGSVHNRQTYLQVGLKWSLFIIIFYSWVVCYKVWSPGSGLFILCLNIKHVHWFSIQRPKLKSVGLSLGIGSKCDNNILDKVFKSANNQAIHLCIWSNDDMGAYIQHTNCALFPYCRILQIAQGKGQKNWGNQPTGERNHHRHLSPGRMYVSRTWPYYPLGSHFLHTLVHHNHSRCSCTIGNVHNLPVLLCSSHRICILGQFRQTPTSTNLVGVVTCL